MPDGGHKETKAALRKHARELRRSLSPEARSAAHAAMAQHLGAVVAHLGPGVVALYASQPDEADPRGALPVLAPGAVAWPRVHGPRLELVQAAPEELVPGHRGILEPPAERPPIELAQLALVVVPALAFDADGHRLGQGGGHYDRLLARVRREAPACRVVGLAYALQLLPALPRELHDQHVDAIVTEAGVSVPP